MEPKCVDQSTRSSGLDALRVVAVLAIVVSHTTEVARPWTFTWHVPVFFFLTGWLWSDRRRLSDEARRRVRTLLVPYAAWLVVIGLLFVAVALIRSGDLPLRASVDAVLGGSYAGRPFTTFWFFTALFATAVLWRAVSVLPVAVRALVAVAGLIALTVAGPVLARAPLALAVGACCVCLVAAGQVARRIALPWQAGAAMAAAGVVAGGLGWVRPLDLKYGQVGAPLASVAVAVAVSWGLVLVADKWVSEVALVGLLASVALVVVLVHPLFLWLLSTPARGSLWEVVLVPVASWAAALLVARTPARRVLVGR